MRSLERHRDVAAYALGVLDEAEAFRFEDHLMECPSCSAHVTEFGPAARQLMLYRRATPRAVHPMAKPGPRLLDRLLNEVAGRNRTRRRSLLYGLAASAAVALASPGVAMLVADGDTAARRVAATDERSGVWAQVTAENEPWGTQVELKVKDAAGPRACRLIAIGHDGSEQMVTNWTVAHHDARENTMMGASAFHADEIARYEVRTSDGEHLVTVDAG
ncbi:zf-HC2 domain-containing protein [Streptomyces sp. NPDC048002]|uniref:zf-HC2 domain-containing protein n=1 Tax=unclassified Streptomyces TaxID=2593676 RepID=UPI0033EA788E